MRSEPINFLPPNVFIYNKEPKDEIPETVTHVKVDPSVKEIHASQLGWRAFVLTNLTTMGLLCVVSFRRLLWDDVASDII
jgi:hypothetical protein